MIESRLQQQFGALERKRRESRRLRRQTICWMGTAAAAFLALLIQRFWNVPFLWIYPLVIGTVAALILGMRDGRQPSDFFALATAISEEQPELRELLVTALEQEPDSASGRFSFLQWRVIEEVLKHRHSILWEQNLERRLLSARKKHAVAVVAVLMVICFGYNSIRRPAPARSWLAKEITVVPGDTTVERGTGLLISARFGRTPPSEATLVLISVSGTTKRIPLERHLADPVFGASLYEVTEDNLYRIEYGTKKTPDYKIKIFDFPALTRADAHLEFPAYTGLTNKTVRDTRRVSAVEGTHLNYTLQLNKPVARARLVPLKADKTRSSEITLSVQSNSLALLNNLVLTNSGRYSLELVDAEGRTNKVLPEFTIQVLTNQRPELKLAFPRGDQRVSSLEELRLEAEASDDFGLLKFGLGFGVAGQEPTYIESGDVAAANEKRKFGHLIALEKIGVEVDHLVSYFAWAEDYGPDGKVRRSFSDMFFAEIRPFEEIFRRDQSGMPSESEGGESPPGNESTKLADLQKQIMVATWKLQREKTFEPKPNR